MKVNLNQVKKDLSLLEQKAMMHAAAQIFKQVDDEKSTQIEETPISTYSKDKTFTNRSSLWCVFDDLFQAQPELIVEKKINAEKFSSLFLFQNEAHFLTKLGYEVGVALILDYAQIKSMRDFTSWQSTKKIKDEKQKNQRSVDRRQKKEDLARSLSDRFQGLTDKKGNSIEQKVLLAFKYHESVQLSFEELEKILDQVEAAAKKSSGK